ncbi:MAG: flavodoxin [Lachnospiraceae bacterium]|nr:flavodoxin [Lachnospiraceae bacterium]
MKTVIIYASKHHGNTKKVCERLADQCNVTLVEASDVSDSFPWDDYDLIGFASGIAFKKFYEPVNNAAGLIPAGKKAFYIYTCAANDQDFSENIRGIVESRGAKSIGTYGCKGFNTFGPLKLIGGMNKKNPTEDELAAAVQFYRSIESK